MAQSHPVTNTNIAFFLDDAKRYLRKKRTDARDQRKNLPDLTLDDLFTGLQKKYTKEFIKSNLQNCDFVSKNSQNPQKQITYRYNNPYADIHNQQTLLEFMKKQKPFGVLLSHASNTEDDFMSAYSTAQMEDDLGELVAQKKLRKFDKYKANCKTLDYTMYFAVDPELDPPELGESLPKQYQPDPQKFYENSYLKEVCKQVRERNEREAKDNLRNEQNINGGGGQKKKKQKRKNNTFENKILLHDEQLNKDWIKFQMDNNK